MTNRELGFIGENTAAELLRVKGYRIIKRNYRCRAGEIDIIAERKGGLSFVEVKTRRSSSYGMPCESITREKQLHIKKAAVCYLKEMEERGYIPMSVDFQVIEVMLGHIENAFS